MKLAVEIGLHRIEFAEGTPHETGQRFLALMREGIEHCKTCARCREAAHNHRTAEDGCEVSQRIRDEADQIMTAHEGRVTVRAPQLTVYVIEGVQPPPEPRNN